MDRARHGNGHLSNHHAHAKHPQPGGIGAGRSPSAESHLAGPVQRRAKETPGCVGNTHPGVSALCVALRAQTMGSRQSPHTRFRPGLPHAASHPRLSGAPGETTPGYVMGYHPNSLSMASCPPQPTTGLLGESRIAPAMRFIAGCC